MQPVTHRQVVHPPQRAANALAGAIVGRRVGAVLVTGRTTARRGMCVPAAAKRSAPTYHAQPVFLRYHLAHHQLVVLHQPLAHHLLQHRLVQRALRARRRARAAGATQPRCSQRAGACRHAAILTAAVPTAAAAAAAAAAAICHHHRPLQRLGAQRHGVHRLGKLGLQLVRRRHKVGGERHDGGLAQRLPVGRE